MTMKLPRIKPISLDELPDEVLAPYGGRDNPRCELNFFRTMIQHPALLQAYTPFAMQLGVTPTLPLRDKEILILRTLTLCNDSYELSHHLYIARQAGMSDEEIDSAKQGGEGLSKFDRALASAAEELVREHCISDATWAILAEKYSSKQLIEVPTMVANYTLLSMLDNSLGIQAEHAVDETWKPGQ